MIKRMLYVTLTVLFVTGLQLNASQIEIINNSQNNLKGAIVYTAVFGSGITPAGDFFDIQAGEAVTKDMLPSRLGKQRALFVTSKEAVGDAESFKSVFKNSDAIERDMRSLLIPIGRTGAGTGLKKTRVTIGGGGDNKLYQEKGALIGELYRDVKPDFRRLLSAISAANEEAADADGDAQPALEVQDEE